MTLIKTWSPYFQTMTRTRGRDYYAQGRVKRLPPQAGEHARAEVRGTRPYTVIIRGEGTDASVSCTCPAFHKGTYCKHIWATLLDLKEHPSRVVGHAGNGAASGGPAGGGEASGDGGTSGGGGAARVVANAAPPLPKARKRTGEAKPTKRGEPEWVGKLSLLRPLASPAESDAPEPILPVVRQVCYLVRPELSLRHKRLVVELNYRQPTATGWSKLKRLRVGAPTLRELDDPIDRELCALVLGGTWVSDDDLGERYEDRSRSLFALPSGAWRTLLRRMIDTQRCFIEEEDGGTSAPLAWDDGENANPWVLWVRGEVDEDGLSVQPELRRGDEKMDVNTPDLIMGGPDGVVIYHGKVAAFDDRGAYRWVTQFRDSHHLGGESFGIQVPPEDADRFIDRLYRMAALPELDLPSGIGPAQARIDPVNHLELLSPSAGDAASRKHVEARMWFTYGQAIVQPGQPGRFVAEEEEGEGPRAEGQGPREEEEETDESAESPFSRDPKGIASGDNPEAEDTAGQAGRGTQEAESASPSVRSLTEDESPEHGPEHVARAADHPADLMQPGDDSGALGLLIRRDLERERKALSRLVALGFRSGGNDAPERLALPVKQVPRAVSELLAQGWRVTADEAIIHHAGPPRLSVRSGIDWFELHGTVTFQTAAGEQEVPLPEILAAARAGRVMVELGDGSQGLLPQQWLREHGLLTALGQDHEDHLRFQASQAVLLDALLSRQELLSVDEKFEQARAKLKGFTGIQPIDPAPTFHGKLRPYQNEALGWLAFLRTFGMGGILADDMGLGKTVQVLAMLDRHYGEGGPRASGLGAREEAEGAISEGEPSDSERLAADPAPHASSRGPRPEARGPSLIVAPRSVIYNWVDEAARFAPELRVVAYTGPERHALREHFDEYDMVVTSYGLMRRDVEALMEHPFEYLVLDEAQAIKNPASLSSKAARLLKARHRLALTGTPVENHLGDLWSIFEFLNPGMLGSSSRFAHMVRGPRTPAPGSDPGAPGSGPGDGGDLPTGTDLLDRDQMPGNSKSALETTAPIIKALRPFILRRTKQEVLKDLPDKTEQTIVCEMGAKQRKVYDELRKHYRGTLLNKLPAPGSNGAGAPAGGGTMMVLEALLRLRQAACHPGLIDNQRLDEPSAKLEALLDSLSELIDEGHKALVFSQFTSLLAIVRQRLEQVGIPYEYLDGQTRDRKARVERFQNDEACPVFLISLKAGGLGLNLTAADYVFILDPWWNPAVEQQAIDRAHRIGQTRHVTAYRLICKDTVEQRIAELQERKRQLADAIVGGDGNLLSSLTREDLETLLS